MARKISQRALIREHRPNSKRSRWDLHDAALSNGSSYLVARNQALETQPDCKLERAFPKNQLGSA